MASAAARVLSGFSRVPVIGENLYDIVGIAYFKDVVRRDFEDPQRTALNRLAEVLSRIESHAHSEVCDGSAPQFEVADTCVSACNVDP